MEPRVFGPQFDVTYSYVTPKMELNGNSSAGSDKWTLNGKGTQAGKIKKAKIAGMNCKPSGQLNDTVTMAFDTDGLTMSLDEKTKADSGDIYIKCGGGFGMSMRPKNDQGGGNLIKDADFEIESVREVDMSTHGVRSDDPPGRHVGERHPQDDGHAGLPAAIEDRSGRPLPGVAQADAAALVEQHDLVRVPGKAHRLLDRDIGPRRHGGAQHGVADPQRQDLFDAVVLDIVDAASTGAPALEIDILRTDAEDERAAVGRCAGLGASGIRAARNSSAPSPRGRRPACRRSGSSAASRRSSPRRCRADCCRSRAACRSGPDGHG